MGALKQSVIADHQIWRLFTIPLLHDGVIHLLVNLGSIIYVDIHLEQKFGPARIGLIFILSALCGSLSAALFLSNIPTVGSSGVMFGLFGAMLAALIRDWKSYTNKVSKVTSSHSTPPKSSSAGGLHAGRCKRAELGEMKFQRIGCAKWNDDRQIWLQQATVLGVNMSRPESESPSE